MHNLCTTDQVIRAIRELNCLEIEYTRPIFRSNKLLFDTHKAKLYMYSMQMICLLMMILFH